MILSQDLLAKYPSLLKLEGKSDEEIVESHDGREVSLLKSIYDNPNLDSDIRGNPDAILRAIDDFAMKEEFLINIGPHKASLLESLIRANKPRVIVELGGYVGFVTSPVTLILTSFTDSFRKKTVLPRTVC